MQTVVGGKDYVFTEKDDELALTNILQTPRQPGPYWLLKGQLSTLYMDADN